MKIAIIGSGISGLAAALRLTASHQVTLFEAEPRAGGHANTVDVRIDGLEFAVDTGFLVLNERTYPQLLALFAELAVPVVPSDMSFSVSTRPTGLEWCGANLRTVFAQPSNALSPRFLRMLWDILRFNRLATRIAADPAVDSPEHREALGPWLARMGFGTGFREGYLLPMAAAIWSCPIEQMARFPLGSFLRFFHNHGLLQVHDRPQWFTIPGGSRRYVEAILARLDDVRLGTPVRAVLRHASPGRRAVTVVTDRSREDFDAVVMATHSPQALALIDEPDPTERDLLGAIGYQPNTAWLHTDRSLLPRSEAAWAAWNYLIERSGVDGTDNASASVTYLLNRLQPLPCSTPVMVSLNPPREPAPACVLRKFDYEHPVFDAAAMAAQTRLGEIQGRHGIWYCGAWQGFGFHEDGLASATRMVAAIERAHPALARAA